MLLMDIKDRDAKVLYFNIYSSGNLSNYHVGEQCLSIKIRGNVNGNHSRSILIFRDYDSKQSRSIIISKYFYA